MATLALASAYSKKYTLSGQMILKRSKPLRPRHYFLDRLTRENFFTFVRKRAGLCMQEGSILVNRPYCSLAFQDLNPIVEWINFEILLHVSWKWTKSFFQPAIFLHLINDDEILIKNVIKNDFKNVFKTSNISNLFYLLCITFSQRNNFVVSGVKPGTLWFTGPIP